MFEFRVTAGADGVSVHVLEKSGLFGLTTVDEIDVHNSVNNVGLVTRLGDWSNPTDFDDVDLSPVEVGGWLLVPRFFDERRVYNSIAGEFYVASVGGEAVDVSADDTSAEDFIRQVRDELGSVPVTEGGDDLVFVNQMGVMKTSEARIEGVLDYAD